MADRSESIGGFESQPGSSIPESIRHGGVWGILFRATAICDTQGVTIDA
jgi:hypothetical protein